MDTHRPNSPPLRLLERRARALPQRPRPQAWWRRWLVRAGLLAR